MSARANRQRGGTYLELMFAISIVAVGLTVIIEQLTLGHSEISSAENRAFAFRKATSILAEIQRGMTTGEIPDANTLEAMADGEDRNPRLTTMTDELGEPLPPDHIMSGNVSSRGEWTWSRRLEVDAITDRPDLRYVRIYIDRRSVTGAWSTIASLGRIVALTNAPYQRTKEYDVYALAIASAPSLWASMAEARITIENACRELETTDNGLKFRLHWITKFGYGRDTLYAPYVNQTTASAAAAPYAYWYPGNGGDQPDLYHADLFGGRVRTESGVLNDYDAEHNPHPHAVADQFNHCMRYPEARALFDQRVAAGLENESEPPLQILLEDLVRDPDRYRNAILVNLHGSALPMPPLRNYSDAARDPIGHAGVRVVTHPARLRPRRDPNNDLNHADSEVVEFRVYAYKAEPSQGSNVLTAPITIQIPGPDLSTDINVPSSPTMTLRRLVGGVDATNGSTSGWDRRYHAFDDEEGAPPLHGNESGAFEMCYEAGYSATPFEHTWIKLYNTPLVCATWLSLGLPSSQRLYGLEYIPSPVAGAEFTRDLADFGNFPKNTARWRIRIPVNVLAAWDDSDRAITAITRIGDDLTTGTTWPAANQPLNRSITHCWWAQSIDAVPIVERFQFDGDPRHNPYADLAAGGTSFPNGYNWHYDDLVDETGDARPLWTALDPLRLSDGFGGVHADAPRLMQILREALRSSGCVLVHAGGATATALVQGGEIAQPAGPAADPTPVPIAGTLLGEVGTQLVDSLAQSSTTPNVVAGEHVITATGASTFWAMDWLGELCPDGEFAGYAATGNLSTTQFHRQVRGTATLANTPAGSTPGSNFGAVLGPLGAVALVDSGSPLATFQHGTPSSSTATITTEAQSIAEAVNEEPPATDVSERPFALDVPLLNPPTYFAFVDSYPKGTATLLERHYDATDGYTAAGVNALVAPSGSATAFLSVVALTPGSDVDQFARSALMLGLRSFHRAGEPGDGTPIVQQPRIDIIEPVNAQLYQAPTAVLIRWNSDFVRFDGEDFSAGYPQGLRPEEQFSYRVLLSADLGETWLDAVARDEVEPGVRPDETRLMADAGPGTESFLISTPSSSMPDGEYLLRIECYHTVRRLHVSHHQVRVRVRR